MLAYDMRRNENMEVKVKPGQITMAYVRTVSRRKNLGVIDGHHGVSCSISLGTFVYTRRGRFINVRREAVNECVSRGMIQKSENTEVRRKLDVYMMQCVIVRRSHSPP
jgi:hypothetical protein